MSETTYEYIESEETLRTFFTIIPNIVYELLKKKKISRDAFVLYAVYKRTAGEIGRCWKNTTTLAEEAGMSKGQVSEVRKELTQNFEELGGLPLIKIKPGSARTKSDTVIIIDIWRVNLDFKINLLRSHCELSCSCGERMCSCGEPKKILYQEYPSKKNISKSSSSKASSSEVPPKDDASGGDDFREKDNLEKFKEGSTPDLVVYKTNGQEITTSISDIYAHFIRERLPYETEVIAEAIERVRAVKTNINNPKKYLISVCETIKKEKENNKKSFNKTKKELPTYDEPEKEQKPKVPTKTIGQYFKEQREKEKKDV